jgi:integrase
MAVKRITSDVVSRLRTGERVSDDKLPGFRVRRQTTTKRVYEFNYYINGARKQVKIGRHGTVTPDGITSWTPETARREAKRLAGLVAQGIDPKANQRGKAAPTVKDLFDRYIAEHVKRLRKEGTAREYEGVFQKHLSAPLGHCKVADIMRADIEKLQGELQRKPSIANLCLAVLSAMFEKSEAWGWRPQHSNPCRHIERYKTKSRERVLIADEMARLGPALASDPEGKLFLVIALTGARVSEITGLKWSYLDLDNGVARLPDSKTGAKTLVLPEPVVEILRDVKGVASSEYVFAQQSKRATSRTWERIRIAAELPDLRIHDLRHNFASWGVNANLGLPIISKLLGHSSAQMTAKYGHVVSDAARLAADTIAGKLSAAMNGRRSGRVKAPMDEAGQAVNGSAIPAERSGKLSST